MKKPNKYKTLTVNGRRVQEHRHVVEESGRELAGDEIVHHKNNNPQDNDLDNLEVLTRSAHTRHHHDMGDYYKFSQDDGDKGRRREYKTRKSQVLRLRDYVLSSEKTGVELAAELGVHPTTITRFRRGLFWRNAETAPRTF